MLFILHSLKLVYFICPSITDVEFRQIMVGFNYVSMKEIKTIILFIEDFSYSNKNKYKLNSEKGK